MAANLKCPSNVHGIKIANNHIFAAGSNGKIFVLDKVELFDSIILHQSSLLI